MNDKLYEELKENCSYDLEEVEKTLQHFQDRLEQDKDLNDYAFHIQGLYNEYLAKTEKRNISYGELAHIQDLSREELEDLENELYEDLNKLGVE